MADEQKTTMHAAAYITNYDGSGQFFNEEGALIELLADGVLLLAGSGAYPDRCVLFVNCNDLFYWACADGEDIGPEDVEGLYQAWRDGGPHGPSIWCCLHRKMRPQAPLEKDWRAAGVWTDELEALPKPAPS